MKTLALAGVVCLLLFVSGCATPEIEVHHADLAVELETSPSSYSSFPNAPENGRYDIRIGALNLIAGERSTLNVSVACSGKQLQLWQIEDFGPGLSLTNAEPSDSDIANSWRRCTVRLPARNFTLWVNEEANALEVEEASRGVMVILTPGGTVVRYEPSVVPGRRGEPFRTTAYDGDEHPYKLTLAVSNYNQSLGVAKYSISVVRADGTLYEPIKSYSLLDWGLPTNPDQNTGVVHELYMKAPPKQIRITDLYLQRELVVDVRSGDEESAAIIILGEKRIGLLFKHPDGSTQEIDPDE